MRHLKGLKNYIKKTKIILLEFHYDDSIIKNYDFQKMNFFFTKNGFKLISKNKMILRKGYEIIYKNLKNFKKAWVFENNIHLNLLLNHIYLMC